MVLRTLDLSASHLPDHVMQIIVESGLQRELMWEKDFKNCSIPEDGMIDVRNFKKASISGQ
jgi:hypothetical protein